MGCSSPGLQGPEGRQNPKRGQNPTKIHPFGLHGAAGGRAPRAPSLQVLFCSGVSGLTWMLVTSPLM